MVRLKQYIFLILNVLYLLLLQEEVLVDPLHRIHLVHLPVVDQEHLTKGPLIHNSHYLKISQSHFLTFQARFSNQTLTVSVVFCVFFLLKSIFRVVFVEIGPLKYHKIIVHVLIVFPLVVVIHL